MKFILMLLALMFSLHVNAEIFVCKDNKNRTTYQDKQCNDLTVRKLDTLPAPSIEEQYQAQERINRMNEQSEQRAAMAILERQQQEQNELEQEKLAIERRKLELLEKQAADEQVASRYILLNSRLRPGFHRRHFHRDHHSSDMHHTKGNGDSKLNTK